MKTSAPALVPFLRSDAQARLLAALTLEPGREASLSDLAAEMGVTVSSAHREIDRLVEAGLLRERRVGRTRLLRANPDYRYLEPLTLILAGTYGPARVVRAELDDVPGIVEAMIFGSYAARHAGEPGADPHDIDVLVVGSPAGRDLRRAAARIEDALHRPVQITAVSPQEWATGTSGFLQEVRSRPVIPIER
jgi:predicted nucleotidyltransferase/biotin operon repressor